MTSRSTPNRLAREKSPYLLQHQWNPVDWHAFDDEAISRARREDKPIFLSIGYSTCHWCHVMERESFEDEATARLMNERYVNIKVDREERPDLDQIYMQATIAMQGQGGWPLSIWLTPDLEPFYCGTYFPPAGRYGRPGFADVLARLADLYRDHRHDVLEQARACMTWLARSPAASSGSDDALDALPQSAARTYLRQHDPVHGGFGGAPKFPRPSVLDLLLHLDARQPDAARRDAIALTLDRMARGGIYDHVGGGFARYSTDERWLVPHFEKMAYDNALLIDAYVDAARILGREDFLDVARDVAAFVEREMTHEQGGFLSAQDADSEGEEGRFYVFSMADLRAALGDDAERAAQVFGATEEGNFEGHNVLSRSADVAADPAFLASVRRRLYDFRERRVRPGVDDKVLTSWNGLMIHALARLGAVTGEQRYVSLARRAAEFVDGRLRDGSGGLLRRWRDGEARFHASLDDHAFLAFGFIGLFEATGDPAWIARARDLVTAARALFEDPAGGFFFAAPAPDLVVRLKESYDGAVPSGNSMMALVCARLGAILHDESLRELGLRTVRAFGGDLVSMPHAYPLMLAAWVELREPPRTLMVVAGADDAAYRDALRRAHEAVLPGRVVVPVLQAHRAGLLAAGAWLPPEAATAAAPVLLLCEDLACRTL